MRFEFIRAERANFPVAMMCRLFEVSRSRHIIATTSSAACFGFGPRLR